jgi:hypothetical protein
VETLWQIILESEGKESVASVRILRTQFSISLLASLLEVDKSISQASSKSKINFDKSDKLLYKTNLPENF